MVVLVDTNVVFDVMGRRQPHYAASNQILCLCRRKAVVGAVAYHTVANVVLLLRQGRRAVFAGPAAGSFVRAWRKRRHDSGSASLGNERLGRRVQAAAAQTAGASFIITRNARDFK